MSLWEENRLLFAKLDATRAHLYADAKARSTAAWQEEDRKRAAIEKARPAAVQVAKAEYVETPLTRYQFKNKR